MNIGFLSDKTLHKFQRDLKAAKGGTDPVLSISQFSTTSSRTVLRRPLGVSTRKSRTRRGSTSLTSKREPRAHASLMYRSSSPTHHRFHVLGFPTTHLRLCSRQLPILQHRTNARIHQPRHANPHPFRNQDSCNIADLMTELRGICVSALYDTTPLPQTSRRHRDDHPAPHIQHHQSARRLLFFKPVLLSSDLSSIEPTYLSIRKTQTRCLKFQISATPL